jgi:hypothetical protein
MWEAIANTGGNLRIVRVAYERLSVVQAKWTKQAASAIDREINHRADYAT